MEKALFLDRDGTINVDVGYLGEPEGLIFILGAKEAVRIAKAKGFLVFIVSNQSGVGRGYFSMQQLENVNEKFLHEFRNAGVYIDGVRYCPHHPNAKCACRKPKPKMVTDLAREFNVALEDSYFIGDKLIDIQTGKNAGCRTILINADNLSIENENEWSSPDYIADDLREAVDWIVKKTGKRSLTK